jgi:hypothetical protein
MSTFQPNNPDYRAITIATFEQQRVMKTLGISIARGPRLCDAWRRRDLDRDHERHADGAAGPRGGWGGQGAPA